MKRESSCVWGVGLVVILGLSFLAQSAQAQTFKVIHNFTGGQDGKIPQSGLTLDRAGNLYGTASQGGHGQGTVFKLSHKGSGWVFAPLYSFNGSDGANPGARVVFGPDGALYGTTSSGGQGCGSCGVVFNLKPAPSRPTTPLSSWNEKVLYSFHFYDGAVPYSEPAFDSAGSMYLTTYLGGAYSEGAVVKLVPSSGSWTETVLYSFPGGSGSVNPWSGVTIDETGNLYGTAIGGGPNGSGIIYQMTHSDSGWAENVLYNFQGASDGSTPYAGVVFDSSGNLYGAARYEGSGSGGTVFELAASGGKWTFTTLYGLSGIGFGNGPLASLSIDSAGNLYGTTYGDGAYQSGTIFKVTQSNGSWTYTTLHDFTGGSDGKNPAGGVILDPNGNLFGTTSAGGANGFGVVWEFTP